MDEENMAFIHRYYSAIKKEGTMSLAGKWVGLKVLMLNETSQIKKVHYSMLSLIGEAEI